MRPLRIQARPRGRIMDTGCMAGCLGVGTLTTVFSRVVCKTLLHVLSGFQSPDAINKIAAPILKEAGHFRKIDTGPLPALKNEG